MAKKKRGDEDTRSTIEIKTDEQKKILEKVLIDVEDVVGNLRGALGLPTAILPTANTKAEQAVFKDPHACPKCSSTDVDDTNEHDGDPDEQTFRSTCNACNLEWIIVYQMKSVTLME